MKIEMPNGKTSSHTLPENARGAEYFGFAGPLLSGKRVEV
jgi:hypothetical protein